MTKEDKQKGRGLNIVLYIIFIIAVLGIGLNTGVKTVVKGMMENSQLADTMADQLMASIPGNLPGGNSTDLVIREKIKDDKNIKAIVDKVIQMNIKNFGKPAEEMEDVDITPELDSIVKDVAEDVESKAGKPAAEAITTLLKGKESTVNQLVNQEMKAYFERIYQKLSGSVTFKAYSIVASRPFGMVSLIVALLTALTLFIRRRDLTSFMFSMGIADLVILGGFFAERLAITQIFMKATEQLLGVGVVPSGIMDKDLITVAVMTAGVFIGAIIARIVRV